MGLLTLDELAPYIIGNNYLEGKKASWTTMDNVVFMEYVSESDTAQTNMEIFENWKDFYKAEPDFKKWIKPENRIEAFYAAKNGEYSQLVPSFCIYMIKRAYTKYESPNLIFKQMHSKVLETFLTKDYLGGGLTLQDVVCTFCTPHYVPLSKTRLKNKCGSFTEIYVQSTDMVALLPNSLADALDNKAIDNIVVTEAGLSTNDQLLKTMSGLTGLVNSTYDLRKVI